MTNIGNHTAVEHQTVVGAANLKTVLSVHIPHVIPRRTGQQCQGIAGTGNRHRAKNRHLRIADGHRVEIPKRVIPDANAAIGENERAAGSEAAEIENVAGTGAITGDTQTAVEEQTGAVAERGTVGGIAGGDANIHGADIGQRDIIEGQRIKIRGDLETRVVHVPGAARPGRARGSHKTGNSRRTAADAQGGR